MNRKKNLELNIKEALVSVTIAVLFFSSFSYAGIGDSFVLCKNNKSVRTLRVEIGDDNKCRAIYTKQGVDEMIGAAQYANACVEIISNVRKNLEEGKWICRDVKEARVSTVFIGAE